MREKRKKTKDKSGANRTAVIVMVLLVVLLGVVACVRLWPHIEDAAYPTLYREYVTKYAREYDLDEALVFAVIRTESGFDPDAESSVGARGLMQLTEETFHWINRRFDDRYTFDDLYDPETAIRFGCCTLAVLFDEFDATRTVIAAYHAGIGEVGEWLDDPNVSSNGRDLDAIPIDQTAHYVYKVTEAYEKYREML